MADEHTVILTKQVIAHLARYYPEGADIIEAKGYIHVQRLNGSGGALIGGELDSEPGMAGCIGMTRSAFQDLAGKTKERRRWPMSSQWGE
jgi:hypothetical protein